MLLYDASKFKNLLLGLSSPGVDRSTSRKAETLGLKLKPQTLNLHPPPSQNAAELESVNPLEEAAVPPEESDWSMQAAWYNSFLKPNPEPRILSPEPQAPNSKR